MKTVYILTHIHQNTNIVGTFTDFDDELKSQISSGVKR